MGGVRLVSPPDDRPVEAAWQAVVERRIGPFLGLGDRAGRRVEWQALGAAMLPSAQNAAPSPAAVLPPADSTFSMNTTRTEHDR